MTYLDFILIIILFFFISSGFRFGLIITLGNLVGTIVGVLVAGHYFEWGTTVLDGILLGNVNLARVVAFIIIFILASRLVGLAFYTIDKFFKVLTALPFLKSINRLAGAFVGFLEGALMLGLVILFIDKFPFSQFIIPAIEASQIAQWLLGYGKILAPLLPEFVKAAESHIKFPINIDTEALIESLGGVETYEGIREYGEVEIIR